MTYKVKQYDDGRCELLRADNDGDTSIGIFDSWEDADDARIQRIIQESPPLGDGAVKAIGDWRIGGYLVRYGSKEERDLQGEYFTRNTDLCLDWYEKRPVLYQHGLDRDVKATMVGVIDTLKSDDIGLYAEAELKVFGEDDWETKQVSMRKRYVQRVMSLVKKGVLGWSSGSAPNLTEVSADGEIKRWAIVEGSLTPTPAEYRNTDVSQIKAAYKSLNLDASRLFDSDEPEEESKPSQRAQAEGTATKTDGQTSDSPSLTEKQTVSGVQAMSVIERLAKAAVKAYAEEMKLSLTDEQRAEAEAEAVKALEAAVGEDKKEDSEEVITAVSNEEFTKSLKAITDRVVALEEDKVSAAIKANLARGGTPQSRVGSTRAGEQGARNPRIEVSTKYSGMSAEDMSYYVGLKNMMRRQSGLNDSWTPEVEFWRELADKSEKEFKSGKLHLESGAVKSINAIKDDELNYSTLASGGDEWVPTLWASNIWERARLDNVILPLFQVIEMPSNPFELPIESTDPTVYLVSETKNEASLNIDSSSSPIPDSKMATGKVTLTARKLGLRVGYSTEVEEDSIIPFTAQLRAQAQRAMLDAIDNVLLNGDTDASANTNINLIDGTPGATAKYLAQNGILKLALVTTTANTVDAGGVAPSLAIARQARATMPGYYAANPSNLAWIVDFSTYMKLLSLNEFLTMDKAGGLATAMTGQLGFLDGIPVLISNEMALANGVGKIPAAGGTLGRMALVYRPGWYVGYRRRVNVSVDYIPYLDSYQLTATVRLAFTNRDGEVAAAAVDLLV